MSEEKKNVLPFLEWREHLCPASRSMMNCFKCNYYTGEMTENSWPDFCSLYTGDLWRSYVELKRKQAGEARV